MMSLDFSKAFLYGDMERTVYIELPDEDARKHAGQFVGLLRKSMYGLHKLRFELRTLKHRVEQVGWSGGLANASNRRAWLRM